MRSRRRSKEKRGRRDSERRRRVGGRDSKKKRRRGGARREGGREEGGKGRVGSGRRCYQNIGDQLAFFPDNNGLNAQGICLNKGRLRHIPATATTTRRHGGREGKL